jgi:hypothetical protein
MTPAMVREHRLDVLRRAAPTPSATVITVFVMAMVMELSFLSDDSAGAGSSDAKDAAGRRRRWNVRGLA